MYCSNCGKKVENGNFCPECGYEITQISDNNLSNQNVIKVQNVDLCKVTKEDEKSANMLCILSIIFLYVVPVPLSLVGEVVPEIMSFSTSISGICSLAGLVLMIVARVKYPDSKFAKILMWVYIATIGISLIVFIVFMLSCAMACNGFGSSGCS